MRKPLIAAACLISAAIISCKSEKPFSYEYVVANNCDTAIAISLKRGSRDTLIVIPKNTSERVFFAYRYEKANEPTQRAISVEFDTIIVYKYHIPSQDNYLKSEKWVFTKYSDVLAKYTTTVTDAEF